MEGARKKANPVFSYVYSRISNLTGERGGYDYSAAAKDAALGGSSLVRRVPPNG